MEVFFYWVFCKFVVLGIKVKDEDMCIIESMLVKFVIIYLKIGVFLNLGQKLLICGYVWVGELSVEKMEYFIDFGVIWKFVKFEVVANCLAWQYFNVEVSFLERGYYEVWACVIDSWGMVQLMILLGWNFKGYFNNVCY